MAPRSKSIKATYSGHGFSTSQPATATGNYPVYPKNEPSSRASVSLIKTKYIVKIGSLRFGVHGTGGVVSTIALVYSCLLIQSSKPEPAVFPSWLILVIVLGTLTTAIGSYGLLPQVPQTSKITWFIIPPHREAFKRTIAIVGYLNIRLIHQMGWWSLLLSSVPTTLFGLNMEEMAFPVVLSLYNFRHFFPLKPNFANGNTWVFVIPMWLGISVDTVHQFPSSPTTKWLFGSLSYGSYFCNDIWNTHVVDVPYLLITLLCALQVAFLFTLAFRGYVNIRTCYWTSATVVAVLCYGMSVKWQRLVEAESVFCK